MKKLEEYTPCELVALATAVGVIIAEKLNATQQNVIGNFLTGVAQNILIIAAQSQNIQTQEDNENSNSNNNNMDLQKQIDELKDYIKKFEDKMNC